MKMAKEVSSRKMKRLENKKRKLKAYLDLAESNDADREVKKAKLNTNRAIEKDSKSESSSEEDEAVDNGPQREVKKHEEKCPKRSVIPEEAVSRLQGPRLSDDEFMKLKARLRERQKMQMEWPKFFLTSLGELSKMSTNRESRIPLFFKDLRNLLLKGLVGDWAPQIPRWCTVLRRTKISHVVTVVVEGIGLKEFEFDITKQETHVTAEQDYTENKETNSANKDGEDCKVSTKNEEYLKNMELLIPRITSRIPHCLELVAPSQYSLTPAEELCSIPLSANERRKLKWEFKTLRAAKEKGVIYRSMKPFFPISEKNTETCDSQTVVDKFQRTLMVLSMDDLLEHDFPMNKPFAVGYKNEAFMFTKEIYDEVSDTSPMFAIDCEMCLTTTRELELTRISMVNEKCELVYHTLVKPHNKIINYLTKYSGITERMLLGVTTRLKDVQAKIRELLPSDAILVGHSLNSDLKALKLMHPYVIDTSLIYNLTGQRKHRSALKLLTSLFLDIDIQTGSSGHDPTEDARAAMKLVKHKLQHDLAYGDLIAGGYIPNFDSDDENKTERTKKKLKYDYDDNLVSSFFKYAEKERRNTALVTTPYGMQEYQKLLRHTAGSEIATYVMKGNKHVSQRTSEVAIEVDYTIAHMKMNTSFLESEDTSVLRSLLYKLDKRLKRIYESAAPKALLAVVFTGSPFSVPLEQRSNGFVLVDIKGQTDYLWQGNKNTAAVFPY